MKSIIARIERIRSGHSERALVHATDTGGREYKIEVPIDDVRELPPGEGHLLDILGDPRESCPDGDGVGNASGDPFAHAHRAGASGFQQRGRAVHGAHGPRRPQGRETQRHPAGEPPRGP